MAVWIDADYLVYGAGAMGMAFVDTILKETHATVVLVDRLGQPGGHWNHAYPFVRLHQPSAFYGVNSKALERTKDRLELASRSEVLAYYEAVLQNLLGSGRLQYFPMCCCYDTCSHKFHSLVEPDREYHVCDRAKIVNATYMNVVVPSVSHPDIAGRYAVDKAAEVVPLNALPQAGGARPQYVIIGAGKTGMDAVLWLLASGVHADRISWIMPNDSWLINRDLWSDDPAIDLASWVRTEQSFKTMSEYYRGAELSGVMFRIDPEVVPTKNKCATVSPTELSRLRTVKNIVRLGHVRRVEPQRLVLEHGELPVTGGALFVDCSADGLERRPPVPVFSGGHITLQSVSQCQQVFSAALIACVEAGGGTEDRKNSLCTPVPHPETPEDFLAGNALTDANRRRWAADARVRRFVARSRLSGLTNWSISPWAMAKAIIRQPGLAWSLLVGDRQTGENPASENAAAVQQSTGGVTASKL